jgi:hypothetical protein
MVAKALAEKNKTKLPASGKRYDFIGFSGAIYRNLIPRKYQVKWPAIINSIGNAIAIFRQKQRFLTVVLSQFRWMRENFTRDA